MKRGDLAEVFARLRALYTPPAGMSLDSAAYTGEWLGALGHASREDVHRALDAYAASEADFWPRPGKLATWIRQHPAAVTMGSELREYMAWESGGWGRRDFGAEPGFTACPVCGAVPGWSNDRLRVPHVAMKHRIAGLPLIGWSDEVEAFYAGGNLARPEGQ